MKNIKLQDKIKGFSCELSGKEYLYTVKLEDIQIKPYFKKTRIGKEKFWRKCKYFEDTGKLESKIVLRREDWMLLDGYSSYVIAKKKGLKEVEVVFK